MSSGTVGRIYSEIYSMVRRDATCFSDHHGICLMELVISLAAGTIVLAAALDTFNVVQPLAAARQRALTQQQELRLGLDVFVQEARLAGSVVAAAPDQFLFLANLSGQRTVTTTTVLPGQSLLAVQDGSGWREGKAVILCERGACEEHRLIRTGQRDQLALTEPVQSIFPSGASVEVTNRVVYYTKRDEQDGVNLMRMVDGGASILAGELKKARFSYRDEYGHVAQTPSDVRRVVVEIEPSHLGHRIVREVGIRS